MNVQDIFEGPLTDAPRPTEAEEVALIARAKAGDEEATLTLLGAYQPQIRSAYNRFLRTVLDGELSPEHDAYGTASRSVVDLQSAALLAFMEAIHEHNPAVRPRLSGGLWAHLKRGLADDAQQAAPFTIPERTRSRFYGILRAAGNDVEKAAELAPSYEMDTETFWTIYRATSAGTGSLDVQSVIPNAGAEGRAADEAWAVTPARPLWDSASDAFGDAEDAELVRMAFTAVSDEEDRVVRLAYGFLSTEDFAYGEPLPDGAIAERMEWSRPKVQRTRAKALAKMRDRLGVA